MGSSSPRNTRPQPYPCHCGRGGWAEAEAPSGGGARGTSQPAGSVCNNQPVRKYCFLLHSGAATYGTIGDMSDHRIRLTDDDIALIVAALTARAAMAGPMRRHRIERLADRLREGHRGNPKWLLDEYGQTHEDELEDDD